MLNYMEKILPDELTEPMHKGRGRNESIFLLSSHSNYLDWKPFDRIRTYFSYQHPKWLLSMLIESAIGSLFQNNIEFLRNPRSGY
jgi:hypothetical protein